MAVFEGSLSRAWQWPPDLSVSQWAERHRVLPPSVTAEPGPWSNARTPYLTGLMDAVREPGVEEIVFVKPVQIGGSEFLRNVLGYWIDSDPGPCLWVMPDEKSARETLDERIRPLLESSPALRRHMSDRAWDTKQTRVKLDTMDLFIGWAGSPQSLASRPCRYVVFDEIDKYPAYAGREADPISLGSERAATFGHRKRILKISTPTTRDGLVWRAFEACGQHRYFFVPCSLCGHFQRLVFQRVRYPKVDDADRSSHADRVEAERLAWYECERCQGRIEDRDRLQILQAGRWEADRPGPAKSLGFHLSSLYSPWRGFSALAAKWIRAKGDPAETQNVYNSWLAEPFEIQVAKTQPSIIREKAAAAPPRGFLPPWTQLLIATADTQKDHFYFVVRAWGYEYRSSLVDFGVAHTFDELYARTLGMQYPFGSGFDAPGVLLIDSGGGQIEGAELSRTSEVYQFCLRDPARLFPVKGSSRNLNFVVAHHWQKEHGIQLWEIDTDKAKDHLSLLIHDPDLTRWMPCSAVGEDYCQQMAAEHKTIDPRTRKMQWRPKSSGAPNHYFDCEVYQTAAAMWFGAGQPDPGETAPPAILPPQPGVAQPDVPRPAEPASPSGWKVKSW